MVLTFEEIASVINPSQICGGLKRFAVNKYCIDSRYATQGTVFFAFNGEKNDGHDFIKHAITNGATCIIGTRLPEGLEQKLAYSQCCLMVVEDLLEAMQQMAIFARTKISAKVICVTGSIGKTTTKEIIGNILSNFFNVSVSPGNKNNHIGLPLSLLNVDPKSNLVVLEVGMNHIGEISHLSRIAKPDIAIITTIAPAHIGNFSGLDEVADAKAEIFEGMNDKGIAILNQENEYFMRLAKKAKAAGIKTIIGLGNKEKSPIYMDNYRIEFNRSAFDIVCKSEAGEERINANTLSISHSIAFNSIFIFALAKLLRLDLKEVAVHLKKFKGVDGRGNIEIIKSGMKDITVINDCYNASPDSIKSGIETLIAVKKQGMNKRAICVLGDMAEMGEFSYKYHKEIGEYIAEHDEIDGVIAVGIEMKAMYDALPDAKKIGIYESADVARRPIRDLLQDKDIVIFKASRKMKLETVIEKLFQA